jgi:integrase
MGKLDTNFSVECSGPALLVGHAELIEAHDRVGAAVERRKLLFPGARTGKTLSNMTFTKVLRQLKLADKATAHGFRSSFRDWATEHDKVREVVAEASLAHAVEDKTEAAYRRAAYLDERRGLMERWAQYCGTVR